MKKETLKKANDLDCTIRNLERALSAFYWPDYDYGNPNQKKDPPEQRKVKLIFEYDTGDGDEHLNLPLELNEQLTTYLKDFIQEEKAKLEVELENL